MTRSKYFICAEISYSFLRQRHQIIAEKLSFYFDVLFKERIPSRLPNDTALRIIRLALKFRKRENGSVTINPPNIDIQKSLLLPEINTIFRLYNKLRVRYILSSAQKGDIVHLFSNNPTLASEAKAKGCLLIFDIVHNWWSFPYHNKQQRYNLKKVIRLSDIVISDSTETLKLAKAEVTEQKKNYLLMHPGVDEVWFKEAQQPQNYEKSKYDVAFFGNLRSNSDINIIKKFIRKDNTNVLLYGLLDHSLGADSNWLKNYYQGKYGAAELVSRLSKVDALLLPYDKSQFSRTIFPAKYFEAMALGLPVISDSEMMHLPMWDELVWTSEQLAVLGWTALLTEHYEYRSKLQIEFARENSWTHRVDSLMELIDEIL